MLNDVSCCGCAAAAAAARCYMSDSIGATMSASITLLCLLLCWSILTPCHWFCPFLLPSIAENTRASYPIDYIDNAKIPCVGPHPRNVVLLCCDAFGVLPPVSKLSLEQVMYHFISGYTSKVGRCVHNMLLSCYFDK
jgi:hypothetical protein